MDPKSIENILESVHSGSATVADAVNLLRDAFAFDLGTAVIDGHRLIRTGLPEVVFAENKTTKQAENILREIFKRQGFALATRVRPDLSDRFVGEVGAVYDRSARCLSLGNLVKSGHRFGAVCAGTSDLPIFDELVFVLRWLGHEVIPFIDLGVAGLHRILSRLSDLRRCEALAVVAGMEGALPSIVAGLVSAPVVAVPTSIGYGVSAGGFAALVGMLSSCSPGISVVNIDNGFGAAAFLHRIAGVKRASDASVGDSRA